MNEDLKVLQLGKFYPIKGGVEKVMYDLTTGLSERGIACDMLCATAGKQQGDIRLNGRAKILGCRTWFQCAATMIAPSMITRLRKIQGEYDIIHIHHPDPMACLALFCSGYKGTVILHWHSDILKQKMILKLYKPLQSWLIRRAARIVGTSPVYLQNSPFLREVQDKTVAVPIGVRRMCPEPEAVGKIRSRYPGKTIVFSLGRLIAYKGYEYLIEAGRHLDDSYVILIGGTGPLKDKLQRQIQTSGLTGKVKLLGFIPDEELAAWYGACDLFCLSSVQKTEAFGIVQIEAMSCGKPVVATRIPGSGVAWVNADGESGLNVGPADAKALAGAIRAITEDRTVYAGYCKRALQRYNDLFTEDFMIINMLYQYELYASCNYKE